MMQAVQELASGKLAFGVSVGTVTSPAWVDALNSPTMAAIVMALGCVLSIVILCVNVQAFFYRCARRVEDKRHASLRAQLLEKKAAEAGITD